MGGLGSTKFGAMATITLSDEHAEALESMVRSGLYPDIASILDEALEAIKDRALDRQARMEALKGALAVGDADFEAGRFTEFNSREDIAAYVRNRAAAALKAAE